MPLEKPVFEVALALYFYLDTPDPELVEKAPIIVDDAIPLD